MVSLQATFLALAVLGASDTVLLDFTASYCGPCQQMKPLLHQLQAQGFPIREVDVQQEHELAARFRVSSIPCFVMLVNGQEVDREVGMASSQRLMQMLAKGRAAQQQPRATSPPANHTLAGTQLPKTQRLPGQYAIQPVVNSQEVAGQQIPTTSGGLSFGDQQASLQSSDGALVARLMAATVRLKVFDSTGHSYGTGTVIDVQGNTALVLTCGHLFRDSQGKGRVEVDSFAPGAQSGRPGQLVGFDLKSDVGLVTFQPDVAILPAQIGDRNCQPQPEDSVINIGCDHGRPPTAKKSHVTSIGKFLGPPNLQVAGQPVVGRSGGGLFAADGRVIGVCNAADPTDNEGLYAALGAVHALLDQHGFSQVYQRPHQGVVEAALATQAPPKMPGSMPWDEVQVAAAAQSRNMDAVANLISGNPSQAEVVCIVQGASGQRQVIVLDQVSPQFLASLKAEREAAEARHMTSDRVNNLVNSMNGNRPAPAQTQQPITHWPGSGNSNAATPQNSPRIPRPGEVPTSTSTSTGPLPVWRPNWVQPSESNGR